MNREHAARLDAARLRARVAVRRARTGLRGWVRPVAGWDEPLGPVRLRTGQRLELRRPEVRDGPVRQQLRRESQAELERWFPEPGDWAGAQTPMAWAERCAALRHAARRGLAIPSVVLLDGELVGEVGLDAVDPGSSTGELSHWFATGRTVRGLSEATTALVVLHAFTRTDPLAVVVVPRAVSHPGSARVLLRLGFAEDAVLRSHRETSRGREDHRIYALVRSEAAVAHLRARLAALTVEHGA